MKRQESGKKSGLCGLQIMPEGVAIANVVWENGKPALRYCEMLTGVFSSDIASAVSNFVSQNKLEGIRCSWILSPDDYLLMPVGNLPVNPEEVDSAIQWHVKDRINFPISEASISHFSIPHLGQSSKEDFIYAIVAKKKFLEKTSSMIMQTGLALDTIDVPEFALRNLAMIDSVSDDSNQSSIGLIEAHPTRTSLLVMEKGQIQLLRQIDWNKKNNMEVLSSEIQRSLYYYENELGQPPVQKFYISPSYQTFFPEFKKSLPFETQALAFGHLKDIRCFTALGGALREEKPYAPQQINLFKGLAASTTSRLTDRLMFWVLGGIILFFLVITLLQFGWEAKTHYSLGALKKVDRTAQGSLTVVSSQAAKLDIQKISREIKQKKTLLQVLQDRKVTSGKCSYLSNYFSSLSGTAVPGLWFTEINVDLNKDEVVLWGMAYSPVLLIQMIKNLNNTLCFSKRDFSPTRISKPESATETGVQDGIKNSLLSFVMVSKNGLSTGDLK